MSEEIHSGQCFDGGHCGVGGFCDNCPYLNESKNPDTEPFEHAKLSIDLKNNRIRSLTDSFKKQKAELEALRKTAQYWKEQARSITDYSETQQKEIKELRARVAELEKENKRLSEECDSLMPPI